MKRVKVLVGTKTVIKKKKSLNYIFFLMSSLNLRHYEDFLSINALKDIITIPHTLTFEDINGHIILNTGLHRIYRIMYLQHL